MRTVKTRTAGEVGSHKYRVEWALAKALTGYEHRIEVTEVPIKSTRDDGSIRHNAVLRYDAVGGACAEELERLADAFINGWFASHDRFPVR